MLPNDSIKDETARQKSWDYAKAMITLEGGIIAPEDDILARHYVKGDISLWQYGEKMDSLLKALPAIALTPQNKVRMEGRFVTRRLLELREYPLKGVFNSTYLKAIHRYLFQDMPKIGDAWAKEYTPGEFRAPRPENKPWIKRRHISRVERDFYIAYSNMNPSIITDLDAVLNELKFRPLSKLTIEEFAVKIASIYAHIDYVHPFKNGNSFTVREFTCALAVKCDFLLDWSIFAKTRDLLYVALLLSVNEMAIPNIEDPAAKNALAKSSNALRKNQKLSDLMRKAVTKVKREKLSLGGPIIDLEEWKLPGSGGGY